MREMLQSAAGIELGDWFEYLVGSPIMDLIAAPYGGARYSIHLDVLLLIGAGGIDQQRILNAVRLTFERRASHALPEILVPPPDAWQLPFQSLAEECSLATDLSAGFALVHRYFKIVLGLRTDE
jgi:hypothetical protein